MSMVRTTGAVQPESGGHAPAAPAIPAAPALAQIARWVVEVDRGEMPPAVRRVARRALIDTIGVALAGSESDVARRSRDVAQAMYRAAGPGSASVWHAGGARLHACGAAFVNAVAAHALDFDDNCYAGFVHGSAAVAPAALAACEMARVDGAGLIDAFIAGAEAQFAVAAALGDDPYAQGWWTTSLYGAIGACAATCRAFSLSVAQTAAALGLTVARCGGMKVGFGNDAKALMLGTAVQNGMTMALLAQAGCTGPEQALDGPNGLAVLMNGGHFARDRLELGRVWRLLEPGLDIKRIPVCLSSHAAVDALTSILASRTADDAALNRDVVAIHCDVPPIVIKNLVFAEPTTPQQAQFSMQFALACMVCDGALPLDALTPAVLARNDIRDAMARITMASSSRWHSGLCADAPEGAFVSVQFADGSATEQFCDYPIGSARRPLDDVQLHGKFHACAGRAMPAGSASDLLHTLVSIETCASLDTLFF